MKRNFERLRLVELVVILVICTTSFQIVRGAPTTIGIANNETFSNGFNGTDFEAPNGFNIINNTDFEANFNESYLTTASIITRRTILDTTIKSETATNINDGKLFNDSKNATVIKGLTDTDFERAQVYDYFRKHSSKSESKAEIFSQDEYFEGDIIGFNENNVQDFINKANQEESFSVLPQYHLLNRNAILDKRYTWRGGEVPYTISSEFSTMERGVIASAILEFHGKTCVRFIPKQPWHLDYVSIVKGMVCASAVGHQTGGQAVTLGPGCIVRRIIIHELMHSLGFFHEQSRADRDLFVRVVWENVIPHMRGNFQKYSLDVITHLKISYDYQSVMHYSMRAFSRNGLPTLVPIRNANAVTIGEQRELSQVDVYKINTLYNCH